MAEPKTPAMKDLKRQIEAYEREFPIYQTYADVLRRVLTAACERTAPTAMVQSRPKSPSSFAEKCVRKWSKYSDPVHELTDLCGARVVVQTLEQVEAVKRFIEENFEWLERDEKIPDVDRFGYRDVHYIVRLKPGSPGITAKERQRIGDRRAELQVRTWVQHAWADTLHDRIYKAALRPTEEMRRTAALLGAIMEDGDRVFDRLAAEVDDMVANYTAHATRQEVEREVAVQKLILASEQDPRRQPALALRLAKLIGGSTGNFAEVVRLLRRHAGMKGPLRAELLMELGYALCRQHRESCGKGAYRRGQEYLEEVARGPALDLTAVPSLHHDRSLHARALARLAWSWECVKGKEHVALEYHHQALAAKPDNPYFLADVVEFELCCKPQAELLGSTRIAMRQAMTTCRAHALAGIEMPQACFTAGRLGLLLAGQQDAPPQVAQEALAWYARGLRHCWDENTCVPGDPISAELAHLPRMHVARREPGHIAWVRRLLELAQLAQAAPSAEVRRRAKQVGGVSAPPPAFDKEVLIISGGADSYPRDRLPALEQALCGTLQEFEGTVICGGTTSGVPGSVGAAAAALPRRRFSLLGYLPKRMERDRRYDGFREGAEFGFSPEQILLNYADLLAKDIRPSLIRLLGFGGGPLSGLEYRIALALGAQVAIVQGTGGAADELIADPLWSGDRNLLPIPFDVPTLRAFVRPLAQQFPDIDYEKMAAEFHRRFVESSPHRLPANLRRWERPEDEDGLSEDFRNANREQARNAIRILQAAGFEVRRAEGEPDLEIDLEPELEIMASLEHGRWNVERLRAGWRPGPQRDDAAKIHDKILPWESVDPGTRDYDYEAIRAFPGILARAGLEIRRGATAP